MPTTLTLAAMASLLLPVQAVKQPLTAPPHKFNTVLCKSDYRGGLFTLGGLRFAKENALAWTGSWVAPFQGTNLERGA